MTCHAANEAVASVTRMARVKAMAVPVACLVLVSALWINTIYFSDSEELPIMWARVANRVDQLATSAALIAALALVTAGLARWTRARAWAVLALGSIVAANVISHGKLQEIGTDSHIELMRASLQELLDFLKGFVLVSGYNSLDAIALSVFAIVCLGAAYAFRHHTTKAWVMTCVLALLAYAAIMNLNLLPGVSDRVDSLEDFRGHLYAGQDAFPHPVRTVQENPNIVVFIGESTSRSAFARHPSGIPDDRTDADARTIEFSNVATAHSHTFPSLFRALTVSSDHAGDRFRLEQETRRSSIVHLLSQAGIAVEWYSAQAEKGQQDWLDALFGSEASQRLLSTDLETQARRRPFDDELIGAFLRGTAVTQQRAVVSFIHGYAGHWPYCDNIPPAWSENPSTRWDSIAPKALFGDLTLFDTHKHMRQVACQEAAVAYARDNVDRLIAGTERARQPVVILYFADHGEDPFDASAHDSSRNSPRHIEVPLLVHFNELAARQFPDLLKRAKDNAAKPVSLDWLSHSILDAAGVPVKGTTQFSVFSQSFAPLPRFALLRQDIRSRRSVIAIDRDVPERPRTIALAGHDYFKRRLLLGELGDASRLICGHRSDSLLKAAEAAELFECLELDIVIDAAHRQLHVVHPPKQDNNLQLERILALESMKNRRLWLDVKNLNNETIETLVHWLGENIPSHIRQDVMIETESSDASLRPWLAQLANDGFRLSYYAPGAAATCRSPDASPACKDIANGIIHVLGSLPFTDVSSEIGALGFLSQLKFDRPVMLDTWDLDARRKEDIMRHITPRLRNFIIPYRSHFDY